MRASAGHSAILGTKDGSFVLIGTACAHSLRKSSKYDRVRALICGGYTNYLAKSAAHPHI